MALLADGLLAAGVTAALAVGAWTRWGALDERGREYLVGLTVAAWPLGFVGSQVFAHDVLRATGPVLLPGLLVAVSLALVVLGLLVLVGTLLPPRPAAWALAVPVVALVGVAVLPVWSTLSQIGAGLFVGPAAMALGVFGSQGLAPLLPVDTPRRIHRVGKAVATGALVVGAALAGFFSLFSFGVGATGVAELTWSATMDPDGDGTYTVEVPFVVLEDSVPYRDRAERALGFLQEDLRLRRGDGVFQWTDGRSVIAVEAEGPVTVASEVTYYAGGGSVEAHTDFTLENRTVRRAAGGPGNVTVTVEVAFDGGYCGSEGTATATVPSGDEARLDGGDEDAEARFWSTACI